MRRIVFAFASLLTLAGMLIVGNTAGKAAPPAGTPIASPTAGRQPLAAGLLGDLPPAPALVGLARVTYAPGATEQIGIGTYSDLVYVESGELTIRTDGLATVTRSTDPLNQPEQFGAGTAFVIAQGDSAIIPGGFPVEISNPGQHESVLLVGFVGIVEGDPAGRPAEPTGVTQQLLGMGITDAIPATPGIVSLEGIDIAANTSQPIAVGSPGLTLIAINSGTIVLTCDAPLTVFRTNGPPTQVLPGNEVTIATGDSVLLPMTGTIHGTGNESASVMTLTVASRT